MNIDKEGPPESRARACPRAGVYVVAAQQLYLVVICTSNFCKHLLNRNFYYKYIITPPPLCFHYYWKQRIHLLASDQWTVICHLPSCVRQTQKKQTSWASRWFGNWTKFWVCPYCEKIDSFSIWGSVSPLTASLPKEWTVKGLKLLT